MKYYLNNCLHTLMSISMKPWINDSENELHRRSESTRKNTIVCIAGIVFTGRMFEVFYCEILALYFVEEQNMQWRGRSNLFD